MDFAQRAARNEEIVRDVNRQIEEGAELHEVDDPMPFRCECAQMPCLQKIELPPSVYERILSKRYNGGSFIDHFDPLDVHIYIAA